MTRGSASKDHKASRGDDNLKSNGILRGFDREVKIYRKWLPTGSSSQIPSTLDSEVFTV